MLRTNSLFHPALARFAVFLSAVGCLAAQAASSAHAQTYSQLIIFGDSLSDVGNDADVADDKYQVRVPGPGPGGAINYTDGRFTSGGDTDPASSLHSGVWHEQLAKDFLGLPVAKASLDGGLDYAYGGATTEDKTRELDFTSNLGITVNNMGQQVTDYLAKHTVDPAALYIVWGGANDIFVSGRDASALIQTGKQSVKREAALITRLATAGAVNFLVPNLPPIGNTPRYNKSAGDIAAYNAACEAFAARLPKQVAKVTAAFAAQGITLNIKILDVYGLFQKLLASQQAFNFYNITDVSQGESAKPDKYLFWDDVHPTTSGHYQLAVEAYTTLTGRPLVQVAPNFTADGFYLTRSGTDLANKLVVPYAVSGTAVAGVDYAQLKGHKNIKPDNFTVLVKVPAIDGKNANDKTVVLDIADGGAAFGIGTVTSAQIQYDHPITSAEPINAKSVETRAYPKLMPAGSR